MLQFKHFIITVIMLSFLVMQAKAQSLDRIPYEGSTHEYTCNGISVGADYEFYITTKTGNLLAGDFDFIGDVSGTIGSDGIASAQIQWNTGSSLNEYEVWLDVTTAGCSNRIFIGVSPQVNDRSIGFDITASSGCFNLSDNSFTISFITLDNNGQPLSAAYFPLMVEFDVNGLNQSQLVRYDSQLLNINGNWFTANPVENTDVVVEFKTATDKYNAPVKPEETNGTHIRSIFAIPEIEFTEELRERYRLMYEELTAYNSNVTDRADRLEPK